MRDISAIRNQALKREGQPISSPAAPRQEQTLSSLRQKENRQDIDLQMVVDRQKARRALEKAIQIKREELETLSDTTKSVLAGAKEEADRILADAHKRATTLIQEGKTTKTKADTLLQQNQNEQTKLKELDEAVAKRESDVQQKELELVEVMQEIQTKSLDVDEMLKTASQRKQMAVDNFVTTVALLELAVETFSSLQKLNSEAVEDVSQTLAKADTIIQRAIVLVKEVDADKAILKGKATELQKQKEWLVDRTQTLARAAKELNMKGQKHG